MRVLEDARMKLRWGREATDSLWDGDYPAAPRLKHDLRLDPLAGTEKLELVAFNVRPFPESIRRGIDEAIGHFRHALNVSLSTLTERIDGKRPRNCDFPFGETQKQVEDRLARSKISAPLHPVIVAAHPWDAQSEAEDDTLRKLGWLSNKAKHERPIVPRISNLHGAVEVFRLGGVKTFTPVLGRETDGDHVVAYVELWPTQKLHLHVAGVFHPTIDWPDGSFAVAATFLRHAGDLVEAAIDKLEVAAAPYI